jgi:hypothetical protein
MKDSVQIQVQTVIEFTLTVPRRAALEMDHHAIAATIAEHITDAEFHGVPLFDSSDSIQDDVGTLEITPQFDNVEAENYEIVCVDHEDWPLVEGGE